MTLRRGAADPKIGKDYKFFYPDAEALVVGMTTANTHFEDIKIKAKRKVGEGERPVLVRPFPIIHNLTRHATRHSSRGGVFVCIIRVSRRLQLASGLFSPRHHHCVFHL